MQLESSPTMQPSAHRRHGITLLEVLISIGILSVGLASVMALIPAGGNQAKKAVVEDRRGTMAVSAFADLVNYGMLNTATWSTTPTAPYRIVIDPIGNNTFPATGLTAVDVSSIAAGSAAASLVFAAGDDLAYVDDTTKSDPENYPQIAKLTTGNERRLAEGSFSWLATIVPSGTTTPQQFYRATIVEFYRRPPAGTAMINKYSVTVPGGGAGGGTTFTVNLSAAPLTTDEFKILFPIGGVLLFTNNTTVHEWRRIVVATPSTSGSTVNSAELLVDRDVSASASDIWTFEAAVGLLEKNVQLEDPSPWTP